MLSLKPPTHRIDGPAIYIASGDTAWDLDKIREEREAQVAARRVEVVERFAKDQGKTVAEVTEEERRDLDDLAARAAKLSPVARYFDGKTRFQPSATDWRADGSSCTVRDFLREGIKPAEFGLRRLDVHAFQQVAEIEHPRARLVEACRLGLRSISAEGYSWKADGDKPATDQQLEVLHLCDPALVTEIGAAVLTLSRPLDPEAEGPR